MPGQLFHFNKLNIFHKCSFLVFVFKRPGPRKETHYSEGGTRRYPAALILIVDKFGLVKLKPSDAKRC